MAYTRGERTLAAAKRSLTEVFSQGGSYSTRDALTNAMRMRGEQLALQKAASEAAQAAMKVWETENRSARFQA